MKYIVDTHILLWYSEGGNKLSNDILFLLNSNPSDIYISQATFWEITIKKSLGKLNLISSVSDFYYKAIENSFLVLHFDADTYRVLEELPQFHQDPFDRIIISQAISKNFTIITQDQKFKFYEELVPILWN